MCTPRNYPVFVRAGHGKRTRGVGGVTVMYGNVFHCSLDDLVESWSNRKQAYTCITVFLLYGHFVSWRAGWLPCKHFDGSFQKRETNHI